MPATPDVTRGDRFAHVSPGPPDLLDRYEYAAPAVGTVPGKLFYKAHAGGTGAEVSLNRVPAGAGVPFLHRHAANDEWYLFSGGRGRFYADGELFEVAPGDAVRLDPAAARSLESLGPEPLTYWCVQVPAAGDAGAETADGAPAEGSPPWA